MTLPGATIPVKVPWDDSMGGPVGGIVTGSTPPLPFGTALPSTALGWIFFYFYPKRDGVTMFYPNHHIRTYCLYLGSFIHNGLKLDLGVYEAPGGSVSHTIVYGEYDSEYMSGVINFEDDYFNFQAFRYQINKKMYEDYLKDNRGHHGNH